jgi:hypothetical protein
MAVTRAQKSQKYPIAGSIEIVLRCIMVRNGTHDGAVVISMVATRLKMLTGISRSAAIIGIHSLYF